LGRSAPREYDVPLYGSHLRRESEVQSVKGCAHEIRRNPAGPERSRATIGCDSPAKGR